MNTSIQDFVLEILKKQNNVKYISIELGIEYFINFNMNSKRMDTIRFYKEHLKPFKTFCCLNSINYTSDIQTPIITKYSNYLKLLGNKNITINKRVNLVSNMCQVLYSCGIIDKIEFYYKQLEEEKKEIKILDLDTYQKIIDYVKEHSLMHQLILLLLITTGIRRTELTFIKIKNINFIEKKIFLERTKSHQTRYIYFDDYIKELLIRYLCDKKNSLYLFENKKGTRLEASRVTYIVWCIKKHLQLNDLHPHMFRHSYGTWLLKNGANIEEVRKLLGHSSLKITQKYLHLIDNDLQLAHNRFNPLAKMKTNQ